MAVAPTQELLPLEGSSSAVWKYFGFPAINGKIVIEKKERDKVHCKLCSRVIKYSGSTTNLRFHLKEHHRSVFNSLPSPDSSSHTRPVILSKDQSTLPQIISAAQPIHPSSARWNKLTNGIL